MKKMKYFNYSILIALTAILFTACRRGNETESISDMNMSCEQAPLASFQNKPTYTTIEINNPNTHPKFLLHTVTQTQTPLASTTLAFDKAGLYGLFQTEYYWASETVSDINYSNYTTPQSLIDDLKNSVDRWSFSITKEDYKDLISQQSGGFGLACQEVTQGCHITYIRLDSPADRVGLKRGDVISQINEENATHDLVYNRSKNLDEPIAFKIIRENSNEICTGEITPRDYTYKVAQSNILTTPKGQEVGYFRFDSFLGTNSIIQEINTAFDGFKEASISKLVIDLRYNGGGSVDIASTLLNKLTNQHDNALQFTLAWNSDYQKNNQRYSFKTEENSLDLDQILFLTTKSSASASELVIAAMQPYMGEENVIVIGDTTHGKPVGMSGRSDSNYYYFLINFVVQNSIGFYDYFDGLPVTSGCNIKDDPFHEMGDSNELMLKAALNYVDTGSCQ